MSLERPHQHPLEWRTSSFTQSADCVQLAWRKSSLSNGNASCVEMTLSDKETTLVRDSKNADGPRLEFSRRAFDALLVNVREVHTV
jgi:hypothetical protein